MSTTSYPGLFVTFEGPEGCGKSTHLKELQAALKKKGIPVTATREPGGSKLGKDMRKVLLMSDHPVDPLAELFLFAADRVQDVTEVILPALEKGHVVLCDRFTDSTLAYQIGGRRLLEDLVRYINMVSCKGLVPDLTLLLDVPPDIGLSRSLASQAAESQNIDRFSKEKLSFHERVGAFYKQIAEQQPDRVKVIPTTGPMEDAKATILKELLAAWGKKK